MTPVAPVRGSDIAAGWAKACHVTGRRRLHHQPSEKGIRPAGMANGNRGPVLCSRGGPTMMARIGVMKALNRHVVREFNPDRKDHHWGKRKLKRDQ